MSCLAKPQVQCPFSSSLPALSSLQCQFGQQQMGWFSMASHQSTHWHVKQAVMGLCMPSTAKLYCHMGQMCAEITLDRLTEWVTWPDSPANQNKQIQTPEYICASPKVHTERHTPQLVSTRLWSVTQTCVISAPLRAFKSKVYSCTNKHNCGYSYQQTHS